MRIIASGKVNISYNIPELKNRRQLDGNDE